MSSIYPCYPVCKVGGKSPGICAAGSTFATTFSACLECLAANSDGSTSGFVVNYIQSFYAAGINWCSAVTPQSVVSSPTSSLPIPSSQFIGTTQPIAQSIAIAAKRSANLDTTLTLGAGATTPTGSKITGSTGTLTQLASTNSAVSSASSSTHYQYGFWLKYTFALCPTRTNPPESQVTPQDTGAGALWGCAAGFVCRPPQVNCDLESGPPGIDFLCDVQYCVSAPQAPPQPTITIANGTTIFSPLPLPTGLFNLNPAIFGADWGIFTGDVKITSQLNQPTKVTPATTAVILPTITPIYTPPPSKPSKAWIAGPVIGVLALFSLILAILFFLRHRRQRQRKPTLPAEEPQQEKAQLDGEGIKSKELAHKQLTELEGQYVEPSEMDAGYTGAEMGRTGAGIRRKPVGNPETGVSKSVPVGDSG